VLKALPPELLALPDLKDLAQFLQRDICISNPGVVFNDIVGLTKAKGLLKEAV
jgi:katanin p60 ATPase-containing subunit A1